MYKARSYEISELIQSSQLIVYFFLTQFLLKIPVFKLNNRFLFHSCLVVDIQLILVF